MKLCGNERCNDVEYGESTTYVVLTIPNSVELRYNRPEHDKRTVVSLDGCLTEEITDLWNRGIVTTGCCCGHNKRAGYIGVKDEHVNEMIELGYVPMTDKPDTFYPKFPRVKTEVKNYNVIRIFRQKQG